MPNAPRTPFVDVKNDEDWKKTTYPVLAENALRMLVATSPDYLTS